MKLFILGATGGIGRHLVRLAMEHSHFVTAYVRSPKKIGEAHEQLKVMQGDVFNAGGLHGRLEMTAIERGNPCCPPGNGARS